MNPWIALLAITAGYLLGAVSFSRLIARIFSSPIDPQKIVVKDEVTGMEHARPVNASTYVHGVRLEGRLPDLGCWICSRLPCQPWP
jgi:hypothetical protein